MRSELGRHVLLLALLAVACSPLLLSLTSTEYLWTDIAEIVDGKLISASLNDLATAFGRGIAGHYYRPTVFFLHSVDFWLFGDSPIAFRATNLALHVLNVMLAFLLVRRLSGNSRTAWATACLFSVHPIVLTQIAWVSDRTDLVALGASLAFFCLADRFARTRRVRWLVLADFALLLGLGAKETPAITAVVTMAIFIGSSRIARPGWLWVLVTQSAIVAGWQWWRLRVLAISAIRDDSVGVVKRVALATYVHIEYLFQFLVPSTLTVCDGREVPRMGLVFCVIGLGLLSWIGWVTARLWRRGHSAEALAVVWIVAFLVPTSGILPLSHVRADRYLYCSVPAMMFLMVKFTRAALLRWCAKVPRYAERWALLFGYAYCVAFLVFRIPRFASNRALWTYETERSHSCLEGHLYLARELYMHGETERALAELTPVLEPPAGTVAFHNATEARYLLGMIKTRTGDLQGAALQFERVLGSDASTSLRAEAAYTLALLDYQQQQYEAMAHHLDQALAQGPARKSLSDVLLLRSYAALQLSRYEECDRVFEVYLRARPTKESRARQALAADIARALRNGRTTGVGTMAKQ